MLLFILLHLLSLLILLLFLFPFLFFLYYYSCCFSSFYYYSYCYSHKSDPATCHGDAWGERRYSSCSFLTSAPDGGEWSVSRRSCALPLGKGPLVLIEQEAGWAPELVWMQGLEEKSSAPVGDRTPIVQPVVRHYTA
jgi:hypothetical protein